MAKRARAKPPKVMPLVAAEFPLCCGAPLPEGVEGLPEVGLGEPVETVPLVGAAEEPVPVDGTKGAGGPVLAVVEGIGVPRVGAVGATGTAVVGEGATGAGAEGLAAGAVAVAGGA